VRSYKSLSLVERAFAASRPSISRSGPVYHWLADRVRAHVFLCMLAYYLEWHMASAWRLYSTTTPTKDAAERNAPASSPSRALPAALSSNHWPNAGRPPGPQLPTLLNDLATLTRNTLVTAISPSYPLP